MLRVILNLAYYAVLDMNDAVGAVGHAAFMCHHHYRHVLLAVELAQQLHHLD